MVPVREANHQSLYKATFFQLSVHPFPQVTSDSLNTITELSHLLKAYGGVQTVIKSKAVWWYLSST